MIIETFTIVCLRGGLKEMCLNKRNFLKLFVFGTVFLILSILFTPFFVIEAKVMVHPTRVSFQDEDRFAILRLINPEDETMTYRISFIQSKMTETGEIVEIEIPDNREQRLEEMMAQDLIRYSPRQVTLPPRETQLVRLQLNKPADLEPGEYRSRLLFQEIPKVEEVEGIGTEDSEGFSIQLKAIYGVSIPVIVRNGETWAEVEISNISLDTTDVFELSLKINREGNRSVYGDLEVRFIPKEGEGKILTRVNRLALYTDIEYRLYKITLDDLEDMDLDEGKIRVIFRRPPDEGGQILAEKEIEI